MAQSVGTMVEGGKATTGPPIGPALGPLGLNLGQIIKEINEKTKAFEGMQVPVTVTVTNPNTKEYEIKVGIPPTSALLKKEVGVAKGASSRKEAVAGNATMEQIKKVAEAKREAMMSNDIRGAMLEVIGTCVSLGFTVEGKDPVEIQNLIKQGKIEI